VLSILHPETVPHLEALPIGLLPFRDVRTGKLIIAIKASKEIILTARMNRGFKVYVAPLASTIGTVPSLVSAFFDDTDEPLTLMTPLFDDEMAQDVRELLAYEELEIYFFDEHNREWTSYRASLRDGGSCFVDGTDLTLVPFSHKAMTLIYQGLEYWFGRRTPDDDARAISVSFLESIGPDDLFIQDLSETGNDYVGSAGYSFSSLTRDNPGAFQERDLVAGFRRVFPSDRIAINPMRKDTGNELADILVLAASRILLVQAKDSPNTEQSLGRPLERKRLIMRQQVEKAVRQAKGAAAYVRANDLLDLLVGRHGVQVAINSRTLFSVVVIKELFADEGPLYVAACRDMESGGVQGIVLDYPSADLFTHRLRDENEFISALEEFHSQILRRGIYLNPQTFLFDWLVASPSADGFKTATDDGAIE
jgi:hypothetical protein